MSTVGWTVPQLVLGSGFVLKRVLNLQGIFVPTA